MKRSWVIILLVLAILFIGAFSLGIGVSLFSTSFRIPFFGGNVALVELEGEIIIADEIIEKLEEVRRDDALKALVLRLNSPGGSVGASQEIFEAVKKVAQKKPVVASMGTVAASGAYYVACGANRILASPGTITGSIGVRMEHFEMGQLMKWAKVNHETLKSGTFKDLTPLDRPINEEERKILEEMLADIHDQFKEDVAISRGIERATVENIADGRVYTGRQALEFKLIDQLGGFLEAVKLAAELGGISGEPKLVRMERKGYGFFQRILGSMKQLFGSHIDTNGGLRLPVLMYGAR